MTKKFIKILTLIFINLICDTAYAENFAAIKHKTHLRWNLFSNKDDLLIFSKDSGLIIKSINSDLISKYYKEIKAKNVKNDYIKSIVLNGPSNTRNNSSIEIIFRNEKVEVFTFYKNRDKKHIIDFWIDTQDDMDKKLLSESNSKKSKSTLKKLITKNIKKVKPHKVLKKNAKVKSKKIPNTKTPAYNPYRDFRYGAALIWDYDPIIPIMKKSISLGVKVPEYFYPIKDITEFKNEEDKHMQLSINLYRKGKWGLMYKSIKLYNKKFGTTKNWELNEYLKVNSILKDNLKSMNKSTQKMAINMLNDILLSTDNYEMRRGIYKYLSVFYMGSKDYVSILNLAKRFYVDSKKNFDFEESNFAAELILNGLAKLRQIDKVNSLLKEKTIVKLLPKQLLLAYQIYTYLSLGENDQVIRVYNAAEKSLTGNIHEVILYNTAEAYFRQSQFKKAIELYDKYLKLYSYHSDSANARLRVALSYDLLDKNPKEVEQLYKTAIDRSQSFEVSYEAKLRYVAFRNLRNKKITSDDIEVRVFMEKNKEEKISKNLLNLKRLVRLRLFIVDRKYSKALSYIKALPLKTMKISYQRIFESEAGEVVNGLISSFYYESKYAKVLKTWQVYKKEYLNKLANDPLMNFIVGDAFVKLGLYEGFESHVENIKKDNLVVSQTYPVWFKRKIKVSTKDNLFDELAIIKNIKLKNYHLVEKSILESKLTTDKKSYYLGKYYCLVKKPKMCVLEFEKFLASSDNMNVLDLNDIADLFNQYTDALFEIGNVDHYLKMSKALLKDTSKLKSNHVFMKEVREKISYNTIELLIGTDDKVSVFDVELKIKGFLKDFKNSIYKNRLEYLLGVTMIKNKKENDGIKMLNDLINRQDVSEDIKELSRSEIALRNIINQEV